ncbi:uncharacterized protein LOC8054101 [Sorghum bicolor]|uniref:Membrane lipoprotein n=1 Tax=Sorghum bicolor TaxID=4558 RepID=C5YT58_SORBI|nr:uncharacterized protein LOC8054101 [Sorghum bicolor]EES16769.1 hypothetical protein SORBI_3008G059700 [Sorghum bicolor]|eukprot:XP_002442931.1 uncharacterized protein LOC8054101 [Sorghum bicolor]
MGPPQRQQSPDQARPPAGSACVWVVAVVLLLAVLAGGGCLGLYVTLPPSEVPQWLPAAGLALVALPWAFWIATCAYRCCCSGDAAVANIVERRSSSRAGAAAVAPMPSSKSLKSALSTRHTNGSPASGSGTTGSPTASSAARRVRFGDTTVFGEDHAAPEKDDASSVHSNESEAPLTYNMQSSSS